MKEEIINNVLCHEERLDMDTAVRLELAIKDKIENVFKKMEMLIKKP